MSRVFLIKRILRYSFFYQTKTEKFVKDYILHLGTNKGRKEYQIQIATDSIQKYIGEIKSRSSIYESEPWGYSDPSTYLNQAIVLSSPISAEIVLTKCKHIEQNMGRIKTKSEYESRTMDIDILFCEKEIIQTKELIIPHPRIQIRRFVLEPLNEILPDFIHPELNTTIKVLLQRCTDNSWVRKI